jgi:hypothetical protein
MPGGRHDRLDVTYLESAEFQRDGRAATRSTCGARHAPRSAYSVLDSDVAWERSISIAERLEPQLVEQRRSALQA